MAKVTMPQLGESVAEGTIGKWLKQPGDHVAKYEPLVEVVTDKVNAEVPSPFEGILREILAEEGASVPNNAEIAVIETADDGADERSRERCEPARPRLRTGRTGADSAAEAPAPTPLPSRSPPRPSPPVPPGATSAARARRRPPRRPVRPRPRHRTRRRRRPRRSDDPGRAPPAARARPERRPRSRAPAVAAGSPATTSSGGRGASAPAPCPGRRRSARTAPDPRRQRPGPAPPAPAPAARRARRPPVAGASIQFPEGADEVLVPATQMRKGIAAQMTRALPAPHAYVQMEIDATRLMAVPRASKRDYQATEGIGRSASSRSSSRPSPRRSSATRRSTPTGPSRA